jgi:hypothetical protein
MAVPDLGLPRERVGGEVPATAGWQPPLLQRRKPA